MTMSDRTRELETQLEDMRQEYEAVLRQLGREQAESREQIARIERAETLLATANAQNAQLLTACAQRAELDSLELIACKEARDVAMLDSDRMEVLARVYLESDWRALFARSVSLKSLRETVVEEIAFQKAQNPHPTQT